MTNIKKNTGEVPFYTLDYETCIKRMNSSFDGLENQDSKNRIHKYGYNTLKSNKKKSIIMKFLDQFKNIMIIILIAAAIISLTLAEYADAVIIAFVVILNALLGVIQENKAEKALESLKKMSAPYAKVKRNGVVANIPTEEIVPGDIVLLEAGDNIPADMRLIESASLKIEESSLTGESVPVEKSINVISKVDVPLGDRTNMAFMGSSVVYGRGAGVVVATGMNTQVGNIASYLTQEDTQETPLQKKLSELGKYISIAVVVLSAVIFATGVLKGDDPFEMFLTAVSLAVAAIPEGLPAIVTIVLALGVQKMAKKNAIIRKLPAVETLGCTQIICSDKTGTLTQNKMTVKKVYLSSNLISFEDCNYNENNIVFENLINCMCLCNDSKINVDEYGKKVYIGDPTETALIEATMKKDINISTLNEQSPRIAELPFDSERKLMTTINKFNNELKAYTKGAPDQLLQRCTHILINDSIVELTDMHKKSILNANKQMGDLALRVLAYAYKRIDSIPKKLKSEELETNLIFIGLTGMIDPPREEVKDAVAICHTAGIRPVMITGDHMDTAAAIAKDIGILKEDGLGVISGTELNKITDDELYDKVEDYSVYARVSPEHKVRIVKAWKNKGKVVAMTGDGVNDAPALKTSDIGVGMGITGTDVSKGVSDMVLSDDNFATIIDAVREGRRIFSNIRKSIQFLLSANIGEVLTLFMATLIGKGHILLAIHILWINLVTDTFPALALGVENEEPGIMNQKPRNNKKSMFADGVGFNIIYQGLLQTSITLFVFYYASFGLNLSEDVARTMAFVTLGLIQLTHSNNVRSIDKSLFKIGVFSNVWLLLAISVSALLQVIVVLVAPLRELFKLSSLNLEQWIITIIASLSIIPLVELAKVIKNSVIKKREL